MRVTNSLDQDQVRHSAEYPPLVIPRVTIHCRNIFLGQKFFISWFTGKKIWIVGRGTKKKSYENDQFSFLFNMSRTNSKTSKVNQQSVLNL